jgi:integrase
LADSAVSALREYLEARRKAKVPQSPDSGLFWHDQGNARYTSKSIAWCLVDILRRAGIKPPEGKIGPRIHDLRHSFVVNRILEWYRAGINPQDKLPCDISRAPRYPLDARLHHSYPGTIAASK